VQQRVPQGPQSFRVVIPARYASTRLPGKALLPIGGKPMLQWVYERACAAGAHEVLIATDDERVGTAARAFGAEPVVTASTHSSGTDRIAEVAQVRHWAPQEIVVNVQGDEPLIPPALIAQVAQLLATHADAQVATLATPLESLEELLDPNIVKVVTDAHGFALYFSRAPIPWNRDGAPAGLASQRDFAGARRHRGIYAYRVAALLRLAQLPHGSLEEREKLEQLRALENGVRILVGDAHEKPGPDVNTLADLERVRALIPPSGSRAG
jgi:3-deoxy-manno-octulosonate cytidylyltransferase (CMP-KDO synthetase)